MEYRTSRPSNLLPLAITRETSRRVARRSPELPGAMRERFVRDYGLRSTTSAVLSGQQEHGWYTRTGRRAVPDRSGRAN